MPVSGVPIVLLYTVRLLDRLSKQPAFHVLLLGSIVLLGLGLRFWNLDAKPLWLDEVLTALFSMGRTQADVPLDRYFPLTALNDLFRYRSGLSCAQIAHTITTESVHPPLFFCAMYQWMGWLHALTPNWVWVLRSLPALLGVVAIVAMYWLNRLAFSPAAGLMAAALMAVSPFAVYLAQEARHYTLPMLLITLALAGLVQMQQDLDSGRLRPPVWLGWTAINALSLYVHYFCLLALVAQLGALLGWLIWRRRRVLRHQAGAIALALGGIVISYLPWVPTLLSHFSRPETDWLKPYHPDWKDRVAPIYQTVMNWVLMVVALPVEGQHKPVAIAAVVVMLLFALWLFWQVWLGIRRLDPAQRSPLLLLAGFTGGVLLESLAIVYLLDKDITVVPRYSFVYYPGICALLGVGLVQRTRRSEVSNQRRNQRRWGMVLLVGVLSSAIVVNGFAFQKPYNPHRVADNLRVQPAAPTQVVVSYASLQEVALGLSFALELQREAIPPFQFAFISRSPGYRQFWQRLAALSQPLPPPLNLWVVASPGMRSKNYPNRLRLSGATNSDRPLICAIDPDEYHRIGFPYQLFRCRARGRS